MIATTTRRITFTPAPGHPAGRYARPASLPAGQPVTASEIQPGVWLLTASVDGTNDYQYEATEDDFSTGPATVGAASLSRLADHETNVRAAKLVSSGEAQWMFDPEHSDVVALVYCGTDTAAIVIYLAEDDFEDDGLYV